MPVNNEREELHRAIWAIADELRHNVVNNRTIEDW